jgi:hypothetical protein
MRTALISIVGAIALASGTICAVCTGCILVTGGTDGYSQAPVPTGGTCTSAAECGDGGMVCCLVVTASTTSTNGTCESTCSTSYPQLCATTAECGDAGACLKQQCTVDAGGTGIPVPLQACGTIPSCVAQ